MSPRDYYQAFAVAFVALAVLIVAVILAKVVF